VKLLSRLDSALAAHFVCVFDQQSDPSQEYPEAGERQEDEHDTAAG